jgi:glutamyl-tRNA reductase
MSGPAEVRLLVLGWNFRTAAEAVRERVAFTAEEVRDGLARLVGRGVVSEGVIVSTCHRSEIYGLATIEERRKRSRGSFRSGAA